MTGRKRKNIQLKTYIVWRNRPNDDSIVLLDSPLSECLRVMGVKKNTFYNILAGRPKHGNKWFVMRSEDVQA